MIETIELTKQLFPYFNQLGGLKNEKEFLKSVDGIKRRAEHLSKLSNNDIAREIKTAAENIINTSKEFHKRKVDAKNYSRIAIDQAGEMIRLEKQYKEQIVRSLIGY